MGEAFCPAEEVDEEREEGEESRSRETLEWIEIEEEVDEE